MGATAGRGATGTDGVKHVLSEALSTLSTSRHDSDELNRSWRQVRRVDASKVVVAVKNAEEAQRC